jgi:PAS domain S-box-containing protein
MKTVTVGQLRLRSDDAVMVFDERLRVTAWNDGAEQLTGLPRKDVLGRFCWEALSGLDMTGHLICHPDCSIARACLEGRAPRTATLSIRTGGGRTWVTLSTLSVYCGESRFFVHLMREVEARLGQPSALGPPPKLTSRQHEVLALLAEGLSTEAIAASLSLSRATIRNHVRAVLAALDCHSRLEAVARARSLGLI